MTGMGFGGRPRARTTLDPEQVGHEAADRALALHGARQPDEPPLSRRARPVRGRELRVDHRPHAVRRRGAARPLAVRRTRGRADRRARPSGWSTTACTRRASRRRRSTARGSPQQTHPADRGRRAAHLPVRHLHGATRPGATRPATASAAPTARRRRWRASNLLVAPGEASADGPAEGRRRRALRDGRGRAALRREPGLGQLLGGRHRAPDPRRRAGRAGARDDDRLGPRRRCSQGGASGPARRPAGSRSGAACKAPGRCWCAR